MSRSNGDSSAVLPVKPSSTYAGSTRHSPFTPSTTAGSPASPTWIGSIGIAPAFARALPGGARPPPFLAGGRPRGHRPGPRPPDPESPQPALVPDPLRLRDRRHLRVGRIDAL